MTGVALLPNSVANALVAVEAAFGADLTADPATWSWTDITSDVRQANGGFVSITIGRADESSQAQPAQCSFQLDNTTGNYTAYNALGSHYPYIRRNTPIRVRVSLNSGSSWTVRFQGFADGWTPSWDKSAKLSVVSVSASGTTRRLQQGDKPQGSAIYHSIIAEGPLAYWSLEDPSGATQAAGTPVPMTISGTVEFQPGTLAIPGSSGAVDCTGGGSLTALLSGTGFSTTSWQLEFIGGYRNSTVGTPPIAVHVQSTGVAANFLVASEIWDGQPHHLAAQFSQVGVDVNVDFYRDGVFSSTTTFPSATLGVPKSITLNYQEISGDDVPILAHVALFPTLSSPASRAGAVDGYSGEAPRDRFDRLCDENSITADHAGTYATDSSMGVQSPDSLLNLLHECEKTGKDFFYDGLGAGLTYQALSDRYAQTSAVLTIDASSFQHADTIAPVDDDQRLRNRVVATRKNGASQTVEDTSGPLGTAIVGTYDTEVTTNDEDDSRLIFRAGIEVAQGTIPSFRYPTISMDFAATPSLLSSWLSVQPGERVDVSNVSSVATQHPIGTIQTIVEGWTENIAPYEYTVVANSSQYRPYEAFDVGDTRLGRLDSTDSTTLAASASVGATSLSVATAAGHQLCTTSAIRSGDFPLDVEISGIQVTVSAISGSSSPQTFTVTGVTKALSTSAPVRAWRPGYPRY